ncbi:hypothetical protein ONE63_005542 [Megalurothrips usitatus]|uniref:ABC transporter domain-containing protein n=1 Tax=Megalurothrips usitatus TaxID=439358 RepID=A0AAV7XWF8_9NEOP|nr:hypothetical protein ONE63_005542 [Megalurothrips usitatus]
MPPAPGASPGASPAAVAVRGARKAYTAAKWILDGLDLTVPEANIYALLGASGCGKTTLLTCILGLRNLNAGDVMVMGWRPGDPGAGIPGPRVGYMPQELALSEGFTIGETLRYFGRVAGMANAVIEKRSAELLDFLQIPCKQSRLISQLSGGQKQRVSLAVTLLHSPPLLILDEPTVGVDPILRQNIWDFLVDLTRTYRTTVIITTHYIEEARQANLVGLMRRGRLLDEEAPEAMMARHGCASLEDVFLALSVRQDGRGGGGGGGGQDVAESHTDDKRGGDAMVNVNVVESIPFLAHSNVKACMWRAWLYLTRYKWVTAYVLMMPLLCLLVFVYGVGRTPTGLHLALVNEDSADGCAAGWQGYPAAGCEDAVSDLSCRYLDLLLESNDYTMDVFPDEPSARWTVQRGGAWGLIHFPANFSRHMAMRQLNLQNALTEDIEGSECSVHLDMSDQLLSNMVRTALFETAVRLHDDMQAGCGLNTRLSLLPLNEMEPVYGSRTPVFQDFALPGLLMCIMYFPAIFYATANFLEDKLNGVMNRSAAAGVTQKEMLAARAILDCAIQAVSAVMVLVATFAVFRFTNEGSYVTILLLLYLQGLNGLWVGYFVAAVCSTHYAATFMGMGIFLGTSFLSGMFWPAQGMHWMVGMWAPLTPMQPAVEAARTVLYQGSNLALIAKGFLILGGWTAALVAATLGLLRFQNKTG